VETLLTIAVPAAITAAGALIGVAIKARTDAVAGYAALCRDLQGEVTALRERLAALQRTVDESQERLAVEKHQQNALLDRISVLEKENARLKARVRELEKMVNGHTEGDHG